MRSLNTVSRRFQTLAPVAPARRWTSLLAVAAAATVLLVTAQAQSLYWDANDVTAGAGATPAGTWGTDLFWSADSNGEAAPGAWVSGSTAVFSAGTDGTGAFTVLLGANQTAGGLVIEEGTVSILFSNAVVLGAGAVSVNSGATLVTDTSARISSTAGSVWTIDGGTVRTINPGAAGSFIDIDSTIVLGPGGGTLSHVTTNILNIVQTTTTISGPGSLTKTGIGVLAVASPCSYLGSTIINDGELRIRSAVNRLPITTAVIVNSPGILNLNSVVASGVGQQIGSLAGNGDVGLGSSTLIVGDATDTIFSGSIRDTANYGASGSTAAGGRVSKRGSGTLTLAGVNTFTGRFTNDAGIVTVNPGASLCGSICDIYINGGVLNLSNAAQTVENLNGGAAGTINLGPGHTLTTDPVGSTTFGGTLAGPGGLTKANVLSATIRTLTLNGPNTYDGVTTVSGGKISVGSATGLGSTVGGTDVASGAEVLFDGAAISFTINEPFSIAGPGAGDGGAITVQNSANVTIGGPVTLTGDTTNTVSGTGTVIYNNPNAITALGNQNLTLQGGGLSTGNGGTISGVISLGAGGLTKQQGGRWTLTAGNNYSGPTLVSAGTLQIANTTGSATGSGDVTVNTGASLSGPGSIAGTLTVNGSIAPGASPGTMNTGSEIWNGGASYIWEINDVDAGAGADPGWDLANINGTLTVNANAGSKFSIDIRSLTPANAGGDVHDFNNGLDYAWTILHTTGGIIGFDPAAINLVTSGFSNPLGFGFFTVELANGGNDMLVRFNHGLGIASQPVSQSAECATGSASFAVVASGVGPHAYQWRHSGTDIGGATAATLTISPTISASAGDYDVVVTNNFGSITSTVATLTLVDTAPPIITSCAPSETLSANASCQAAIPDLTGAVVASDTCSPVTRSQVPAAGTLVGTGPHTVTITILDAANNPATCQATVTVNDATPPVITACANNQTNIAVLANCQIAIPDLTGQVATTDNCAGLVTVSQSPLAGTLVGVGDHVVTLTAADAANNTATCQATVTVVSAVTVTVNSPTICPGGSVMLTATTAAASPSYLWSPGGATTASISVSPAETTVYTVTVTDGTTSCTGSGSGTVTVGASLVVTVNSTTICTGGSALLTATTDATGPSYLWSPGGATTASIMVSPTETTAYSVTVTDGAGCTGIGSGTVTVNPLPTVSVNSATVCAGVSATLTATTSAANPAYLWSPGGATTASITVSPTETTIYTVTVTDGTTTCANTASGTVTVTPLPTVSVDSSTICAGSSATLTATTSASNPSYLWSPGGATTSSIMVSPIETTVYTVTVTDGTTTCANSASGTVTVNPAPTVTVNSPTICVGDSATLTATTSAANPTYLWSPGGETTASITVTPAITTAYSVTVTDGTTTCSANGSGTVTVKQPVTFANSGAIAINDNSTASPYPSTINVSGQTATVCRVTVTLNNLSHDFPDDVDLVLVGPNGRGVLLMSDVGGGSAIGGATLTFDDAAASSLPDAGQIVSGTFKPSNIGAKVDNRPDNFPLPAPTIQFQTNLAVFSGINPNGAWSLYIVDDEPVDFGAIAGGWSIGITTVTPFADLAVAQASIPDPVAVGSNLTFTITVNNNGPADAGDVVVADALPAGVTFVSAASSQGSCTSGAGSVSCSLGTVLAGNSATVTVVVAPSANATIANLVTVTSSTLDFTTANNTSSISTIVLDPPVITLQPLSQTVCADQNVSLVVTATGSAPLAYQWYKNDVAVGGATASAFSITGAQPGDSGSYTVVVANSVGAIGSVAAVVTVNPLPTVAVNSETICLDAAATLSATTSAANPSYLWSPGGATSSSITVNPASTTIYTVLVTDGVTGCTNSASGTVTVNPLTVATAIQNYTNVCPGSPVTFSTVAGGTPPFTYEWRKDGIAIAGQTADTLLLPSVVLADAGTYSVVVTGTCGAVTNSGTLSVVAPPTITTQPQNQTTPMGNGAVFVVAASSVVTSNIQWQLNGADIPGATSTSLAVSNVTLAQNGEIYRVVVSNCGGSTTSVAATLTVTPISGISFNFDTPGQFTNAPYALNFNDWLQSSFNTPPTVFESPIGGVGPAWGGGSLDMIPNNGTVNSSILVPLSYDFSLPGKTLTAVAMVRIKNPTANARNTQIGFTVSTNADLDNGAGRVYMSALLQSTAQPAPTFEVRSGTKPTAVNSFIEGSVAAGTAVSAGTLAVSNWYRFKATFSNNTANIPNTYRLTTTLENMGIDGLAAPTVVGTLNSILITNANVVAAKALYFVVRGQENCGVDFWDNFYAYASAGAVEFVQQPASQTTPQGRRVTFRALVDGEGPYTYQWFKNGSPIAGAQNWKHVTPPVLIGDNGAQYTVTVTGPGNSVTSDPATLAVTADPLAVVSAGSIDGTTVGIKFNQPVDVVTAENPASYSINGVAPSNARVFRTSLSPLGPEGIYVVLTPAGVVSGSFTVTVSGVTDLSGGAIGAANGASGSVAGFTGYDVNPLVTGPAGEDYSFGPGQFHVMGGGADIFGVADQFRYVYTQKTGDFDVKVRVPYVDVVRNPTKAGFHVRESLSPFSPNVMAYVVPMWPSRNQPEGTARATYNAATVSWGANPTYNLSWFPDAWVRFRRTGNTFHRYSSTNGVNWNYDGQVSGAVPATVYFGLAVCAVANNNECRAQFEEYGDFAGYPDATIAILTQPTNTTVAAGSAVTINNLTATITGAPAVGELAYLWQREDGSGGWTNLLTAGATNNTVGTGVLLATDNGAQYRAVLMAPGVQSVTSSVVTVTVTDTALPTLTSANGAVLPSYPVSEVLLNFSEALSLATATDLANYTVTNAAGVQLTVLSATFLGGDPRTVLLKVDGQLGLGNATVSVSGIRDLNNNLLASTVRTFRTFDPSTAPVVTEVFQDIGNVGTPISNLTSHAFFLNDRPTFIVYSNLFGFNVSLAGVQDNYGVKAYTYFVPPTNGPYKFWLRSDDAAQIYMNTNSVGSTNPAAKVLIVQNTAANANYTVGTAPASSITNITLNAGQPYYIEAVLKEGTGGDGFSVMWTAPTVNTAPAATVFIPPANLAFPSAVAPRIPVISEFYFGYTARQAGNGNLDMLVSATNLPGSDYIADSVAYNYIATAPSFFAYQKYFGVQPFNLANTRFDNYLGRMISLFVAPSNGLYRFWIRSDDSSQLWMNTNAVDSTDPAGKKLLGQLNAFTAAYTLVAQNVPLVGGQSYYLEGLWREGTGGDGMSVAVRAQSDTATPPTTELIPGSMLELPLRFARVGAVDMVSVLPANPTVIDGREITLTAEGISGAPPYGTMWLKNGVRVMDNSITNRTGPLTLADNGAVYTLVVTNPFSRVERSVTLTVLPDNAAPTVLGISGWRYGDGFTIEFSDPMEAASAAYLANYQVSGGLTLIAATLDPTRTRVSIRTSPQAIDSTYTVTLNGVRDASSSHNPIAANTAVSFSTWSVGGSGFLVELFTNIVGSTIMDLTSSPKFVANAPDVIYYTNIFGIGGNLANNTTVAQNSGLENYGARLTGYYVPTNTGYYRFFIRSDDAAQLLMNINSTDSENPAGRTLLLHMPNAGVNVADARAISPPVLLNQSQRYYTEALLKEGTGGDYLQVIVRPSDANGALLAPMPVDNNTIENSTIAMFGGAGAPGNPDLVQITQIPPAELSVTENDRVTLTLGVSMPLGVARAATFQWQRSDGASYTNIPGATSPSYTFFAKLDDDSQTYRVVLLAPGRNAAYTTLMHVSPDTVAPRAIAAGSVDGSKIGVLFNEPLFLDTAVDPFRFEIDGDPGVTHVVFFSELRPDGASVILTIEPPVTGEFTVRVIDMQDTAANGNIGNSEATGRSQGFTSFDIGAPAAVGSAFTVRDGEVDVIAGGADIWTASDQGHLTLKPRYGDFDVWTRIQGLTRVDAIAKAGIMVRESTNANSRTVHLLVNPPILSGGRDQGEAAQRPNTGAATALFPGSASYVPVGIPNAWVRIKRQGDLYTAMRSSDGANWIVVGSTVLGMGDPVLLGLATTAHNNAAPATLAEYRDLHIPDPPVILVQPSPASQAVTVHGSVTYSVVASNPPNSGPLTYQWRKDGVKVEGATIATLTLNDVQAGQAGVYTVWVGNDGGATISSAVTLDVNNAAPVAATDTLSTPQDVALNTPVGDLLANDTDANGDAVSIIAVSGLYPGSFVSDFNSGVPAGAVIFGNATAEVSGGAGGSGYVRLNPSAINQVSSLILNELTPRRRVSAFTASFKLRISEGSAQPADGFSFNFAPDLVIGTSTGAENGIGTGLSFCVDNYQFAPFPAGGTANTSGMKLRYGGLNIAGVQTVTWDRDAFVPVTVTVDVQGNVNVFVDGTNVFGNVVVPWVPRTGRFGFYARTGGERQAHAIDDLSITLVNTVETAREANLGGGIFGNAYVDGGFLHLNDAVAGQAGSLVLNELTPGVPITSFTASFNLRIGNGSGEPADGFSFNFANDLPLSAATPAAAENGGGTGFSFCVDNYRFAPYPGGGTAATSGMKIRLGGIDVAGVQMPTWNSAAFIPVSITLATDGALTVLVNGTNVFGNLVLPVTPSVGRFGLYGRTGGQLETHWVDDLAINVTTAGSPASFGSGFNFPGVGTVVFANNVVTYTPPGNACGVDTYYYLATDGQSGSVSIGTVNVNLTVPTPQPPVILACAASRTIEAGAGCQVAIPDLAGSLSVNDCATFVVLQSPAPGTLVGIGSTTVTLTVSNTYGLTATCQATITVADTTPPQLVTCPAPVLISADLACVATMPDLQSQFVVADNCSVTVSQVPAPGTVLALGLTSVTLTATDNNGNSTNCLTAVTVQDTTPPAITCPPNQTAACTSSNGAVVNFTATATDNCTALVPVICTPSSGSTFAIGVTTVTCAATDGANNTSPCSFTVTVSDSPQPTMTIVKQTGGVLIRWPQTCTPYVLEVTETLGATAVWTPVTAPVVPVGTDNEVTIAPADGNKFYRLTRQQ